jgi:hypothetical protein
VLRKLNAWVNSHQKSRHSQLAASQSLVVQTKTLRRTIDNDLIEFSPLSSPMASPSKAHSGMLDCNDCFYWDVLME